MSKKKAIKIATASAIAASAFAGVPAIESQAATNSVDKAITKATTQVNKAFNLYYNTTKKSNKLPSGTAIRKEVKLAEQYYAAAQKEIAKNGGSKTKKAAYTKKLEKSKTSLNRAKNYVAAISVTLKASRTALATAVKSGNETKILSAAKALDAKIVTFEKAVKKVYGPAARTVLTKTYATPAKAESKAAYKAVLKVTSVSALNDANSYLSVQFNTKVSELETSDIKIQDAKTGASYGVKTVTLSKDGKTATVELYAPDNAGRLNPVLKNTTDYTVTINANGKTLTTIFNRAAYLEEQVVAVDVDDRKITLASTGSVEVLESVNLDFEEAKGRTIRVWVNSDNEVVKYVFDDQEKVIYSAIQFDKADELKVKSDGKNYKLSNKTFKFQIGDVSNNADTSDASGTVKDYAAYRTANIVNGVDPEADFAKVVIGKNGEVEYIGAYDWDNTLVVKEVSTANKTIVGVTGTDSVSDADKYLVVKDGKVIKYTDLKAGDVVFFDDAAYNNDGYAVVYNQTVTGTISNVYTDSIEVGGKVYKYDRDASDNSNRADAKFLNSDGDFETITTDDAEDLQAGGEVTLYLDHKGDLIYVTGKTDVASSTKTALLTDALADEINFDKTSIQLEGVYDDGKDFLKVIVLNNLKKISIDGTSYNLDQKDTSTTNKDYVAKVTTVGGTKTLGIYKSVNGSGTTVGSNELVAKVDVSKEGILFNFKNDQDGNVKELEFFNPGGSPKGKGSSTATLEAGDTYLEGKKILSSAVVFDAKDGYDASGNLVDIDADDVTTTTWGQYKGSDINKSDFIYNDDNEIVAIIVKSTTTSDEEYREAVITNVLRNTDHEITSITAYVDGVSKTIKVDKVIDNAIAKGEVAVLKFSDKDLELVKDIYTATEANSNTALFGTNYTFNADIASTGVNVGERTVTIGGTTYKLVNDGAVIDATNKNDIKVKALSDLRGATNVTVIRDEKDSTFVKYFVIGSGQDLTAPNKVTGLAFTDTDTDANQIGGEVTFTASTSTDVASTKVFLGTTEVTKDGSGKYTIAANTAFTAGTKIKVVVTDNAGNTAESTIDVADVTTP
ncbi:hypothetical protein ACIQ4Z_17505 [Peribacillus asahii]|uniref:hypothetical protein n=1 Tax=Peribacillus asahii TaxID=228899 RepID=UPI003828F4D8